MQAEKTKRIEYKIVSDEELPPLVITKSGQTGLTVVLNQNHTIWLSLHRNTIPAIMGQLQEKLTMMCDSYLTDQILFSEDWD
ncbi:MAG: hypothetical protein CMF74_12395 [Maricaulis sp.]|jgi:hypothetical protein|nr:hypothetical protein [Maricaulis sp.]